MQLLEFYSTVGFAWPFNGYTKATATLKISRCSCNSKIDMKKLIEVSDYIISLESLKRSELLHPMSASV